MQCRRLAPIRVAQPARKTLLAHVLETDHARSCRSRYWMGLCDWRARGLRLEIIVWYGKGKAERQRAQASASPLGDKALRCDLGKLPGLVPRRMLWRTLTAVDAG